MRLYLIFAVKWFNFIFDDLQAKYPTQINSSLALKLPKPFNS